MRAGSRPPSSARAGLLAVVVTLACLLLPLPGPEARAVGETTFTNPLLADGADPWLTYHNGNYYLATTTWTSQLVMRKSPTLAGLATAAPVHVWSETNPSRCCNFWAFEFHRLNGPNGWRWYMMFTAGTAGTLDNQHLVVLESAADDPMGPYSFRSEPLGTAWGIDGSYLRVGGSLHLLYSAWNGAYQNLYIAPMSNPWTVSGSSTMISQPTYSWEQQGGNTNEAPVALQRNGQTHIIYSASSCNTQYYRLGRLTLTGSNPLNASSWTKASSPVFQAANGVYGPGHNGFFTSPDGTQEWIVYHGNATSGQGCGSTRSTRAQSFTWNSDGTPNFGSPASTSTSLAVPSGEHGPITTAVRGAAYQVANRNSGLCLGVASSSTADGANVAQAPCGGTANQWVLDPTADGYYRLVNSHSGKALDAADCGTADGTDVRQWAWLDNACQQWQLTPTTDGWFRLTNRSSGKVLDVSNCGTASGTNVRLWSSLGNTCQEWRLGPVGTSAVASTQSGKVLDVTNCSTAAGADVRQWEWLGSGCQRWSFTHTDNGYYRISPSSSTTSCLIVSGASTADGAGVVQGACSGANSQWRLAPLADGSVRLLARHSGKALDLSNCGLANGSDIAQWAWLDNICQRFHLLPV
ncbi:RICIN domain-containing protein [Parafrankia elaeagni]|uniref:RICIN domain-containing protein n=1 Tax=Parafrankia elaeagni TaxID=222534 RepID=UPI00036E9615|nr:RICIN domain-containing protein [Parafrankia elaeagni]